MILPDSVQVHPKAAIIHYNLACYECVLNNMELSKEHISRACTLNKNLRLLALDDEDLEGMWNSISSS